MPPPGKASSHRAAAGPSRTYGSKPSSAHRIMRTQVNSHWLDETSTSSNPLSNSPRSRARLGSEPDADPLHLHGAKRTAVALAADSSSSVGEDSADHTATLSPGRSSSKMRIVQETPSPTEKRSGYLSLSESEDDVAIVETALEAGSLSGKTGRHPDAPSRAQSQADTGTGRGSSESEESEIESPRTRRTQPAPRPLPRAPLTRPSSKPLLEVLLPQPKTAARPPPRPSPTKSPPRVTRSQSPLITSNGARATDALADVIRRSRRNTPSTRTRPETEVRRPSRPAENEPSKRPRRPASPASSQRRQASLSRSVSRASSVATEELDDLQNGKVESAIATSNALRALALDPLRVPRKSNSIITIDVPLFTASPDRPYRPPLARLPDTDETPRPGPVRSLRSSIGKMPASDPDSLRGLHGSSPLKRRRSRLASRYDYAEDSSEESDEESDEGSGSSEEEEDTLTTLDHSMREAAAVQMSQKEHSVILGPDPKVVDENMMTLLSVCGQKTFIPFSRILSLLGAAPAPRSKKKRRKDASEGAGTLVKIGEATYSEVFRLTTEVSYRPGAASGSRGSSRSNSATETWQERKVLKIVPIRKDRSAEPPRRKDPAPPKTEATNGKRSSSLRASTSAADKENEEGSSSDQRRRGGRARQPSQKRTRLESKQQQLLSGEQAQALRRKRARERLSTGPELSTARDVQREIEVTRALSSLNPDGGAGGAFGSFVKLHAAHIVAGQYPKRLLEAWDDYDQNKEGGSENWRPDTLEDSQIFAVIVLGDGGRNLEHSELQTWQQAASIFWQLVHAIATAEMAIQFEHRDLHWGNVLISPRPPEIEPLRSATLKSNKTNALSVLASPRSAARQAAPSLVSATTTIRFLTSAAERGRRNKAGDVGMPKATDGGASGGVPFSLSMTTTNRTAAAASSSSSSLTAGHDFARALEAQNAKVYATIIDFALSRVTLEPGEGIFREDEDEEEEDRGLRVQQPKRVLAYDFDDEEIFEGKGDPQFDVYRDMRDLVEGDWDTFRPITNVMWLSFFVEKLTATHKLPRLELQPGKNYVGDEHRERYFYSFLRQCQRRIYESVEDLLEHAFDARDAAAKAKRTGRPIEDFLPSATAAAGGGGVSGNGERSKRGAQQQQQGGGARAPPKPLGSAKAVLRWMRREVERLEDGFHAGDF
ncbi:hypothetical protein V8E36_007189 [Tilletia maclaganii]